MYEAIIFAELLQVLSKKEKRKLQNVLHSTNKEQMKILLIEYIKKYKKYLSHLF